MSISIGLSVCLSVCLFVSVYCVCLCAWQTGPVIKPAADDSLLETMSHAADALQCRVAAGRSQLTSAMLQRDVKQSVIDDTVDHMMTGLSAADHCTVSFTQYSTVHYSVSEKYDE